MKYADIVPTSTAIRGQPDQSYYLRKDLDACRAEHDAVLLAHGHSAIDHWRKEQRAQNAQPLAEFIKKLEAEQKAQRQEKVEARLLKLGWENGDFEMRDAGGARQWESFVCS
ncbi:hypothetical protein FRC09_014896 [Ceratobasidium sp. 395]|nr:hypothetical protein FRC09_014896 [Ceratobasidium sp. 395]